MYVYLKTSNQKYQNLRNVILYPEMNQIGTESVSLLNDQTIERSSCRQASMGHIYAVKLH